MITLDKIEDLTLRTQAAHFQEEPSRLMILDILARHRKSILALTAQVAECEEIEKALIDLEAYLDGLDKAKDKP